jgi:hypothetical protein
VKPSQNPGREKGISRELLKKDPCVYSIVRFGDVKEDPGTGAFVGGADGRIVMCKPSGVDGRYPSSAPELVWLIRGIRLEKPSDDPFTDFTNLVQQGDGSKFRRLGFGDRVYDGLLPDRRNMT